MDTPITYKSLLRQQVDDFTVEYELPINYGNYSEEITEIDGFLHDLSQKVSSLDLEIDKLTNHADALDYTVAVASGILTGLIDSFFVGRRRKIFYIIFAIVLGALGIHDFYAGKTFCGIAKICITLLSAGTLCWVSIIWAIIDIIIACKDEDFFNVKWQA